MKAISYKQILSDKSFPDDMFQIRVWIDSMTADLVYYKSILVTWDLRKEHKVEEPTLCDTLKRLVAEVNSKFRRNIKVS